MALIPWPFFGINWDASCCGGLSPRSKGGRTPLTVAPVGVRPLGVNHGWRFWGEWGECVRDGPVMIVLGRSPTRYHWMWWGKRRGPRDFWVSVLVKWTGKQWFHPRSTKQLAFRLIINIFIRLERTLLGHRDRCALQAAFHAYSNCPQRLLIFSETTSLR